MLGPVITGRTYREIVRQQYNFNPPGTTSELEDYTVDLSGVTGLELSITPDIGGSGARASLARLRLAGGNPFTASVHPTLMQLPSRIIPLSPGPLPPGRGGYGPVEKLPFLQGEAGWGGVPFQEKPCTDAWTHR